MPTLRLLLIEDSDEDALLTLRELARCGFKVSHHRVQTRDGVLAALAASSWDIVISDHSMPGFDALQAIALVRDSGLDLPIIILSGTIGEESAVQALKAGAHDFIVKGRMARLAPAVERELREAGVRAERRQIQEQLMVSDRMASVGMLAAGVAHEINNPLAALMANLSVVRETLEELQDGHPGLRGVLEAVVDACEASERVRQIVRDVKIFSRGHEDEFKPVDVHRVLDSTLRMAWNDIRHRARVVKNYGKVRAVMAPESRLGQVFLNLVVNAAQALPEGHSSTNEIRLSTMMEGDRVVVEVADTGPGVSPEVIDRLFTPFFTTKERGAGTGLGLSICRRLLTGLGGEITVDSTLGHGARFRVVLPSTDAEAWEQGPLSAPVVSLGNRRARILVVDDELMITTAIRRILGSGHDISVVFNGGDAIARIASGERFDLILCDIHMPDVSGMAIHERLAAIAPQQAARMIFMTGGSLSLDAAPFLAAHADQLIEKPFDKVSLVGAVVSRLQASPA